MSDSVRLQTRVLPGNKIEFSDPQLNVGDMVEIIVRTANWRNADEQLSPAKGILPPDDAREIMEAVEDAFEQVDPDAWK